MFKASLYAFGTATLLAAGSAEAATVLIDWSTATNISDPAGDGKYWNSLGQPTTTGAFDLAATALVDVDNNATGISVAVDVTNGSNTGAGFGGNAINGPSGADPFDEAGAIIDGIYANNNTAGTAVITFTGLSSSTQYDFVAIGGRASGGDDGIIEVLEGTSGSSSYTLKNDGTLLSFSVTSTAGGVIEFDYSRANAAGSNSTWNAVSITEVPEPGSLALLGLGGLCLLKRRRRS